GMNSSKKVATHSALVTALTDADRGPGSIRHISPNTSPALSVATVLAFASRPTLISTEPETMRNAVLPSSPSEIIVSPALRLTVCIDVTSKIADNESTPPHSLPRDLPLSCNVPAQHFQ